jgi:hypothetical protein
MLGECSSCDIREVELALMLGKRLSRPAAKPTTLKDPLTLTIENTTECTMIWKSGFPFAFIPRGNNHY